MKVLSFICGFLMAMADSVPGVSGGTIAYVLGMYDKLIVSVHILFSSKPMVEKKEAVYFLLRLGLGWIIGLGISVTIITGLMDTHIYEISSLFLGFIVFSIPFIIKGEKKAIAGNYSHLIFALIGLVLVVSISYFNPSSSDSSLDTNFSTYLYLFFTGFVAICAMLLPGVSGSTVALIFGVYFTVIEAVKNFFHFDFSGIFTLISFGLGVLLGIIVAVKVIKYAFEHFRSQTTYLILGLMLGSLYAVVNGPKTLDIPQDALGISDFSVIFFILGGVIIYSLEVLKKYFENK